MGVETLAEVFSNVALTTVQTTTGVTGELSDCCNCMQGYRFRLLFPIIIFALLLADAGTNTWECRELMHTYSSTTNYYNITNSHQMGYLNEFVNEMPTILIISNITTGIRLGILIFQILLLLDIGKFFSSSNVNLLESVIVVAVIICALLEFVVEILGVSLGKLIIAFKSIAALKSMQTTSSQVSNGITVLLALTEYGFLTRRTYLAYIHSNSSGCCGCCRGASFALSFVTLFLFQSISLGTTIYAFAISLGVVNIDVYDKLDFWTNLEIVAGITFASFITSLCAMVIYHRCCSKNSRNNRVAAF